MAKIVGIGAYSQPLAGKLLGTGGCAPCAAAAMGAEDMLSTSQTDIDAQYESAARYTLAFSVLGLVSGAGAIWWLVKD